MRLISVLGALCGWLLADSGSLLRADFPPVRAQVDAKYQNHWPADWERDFQQRGRAILEAQCAANKAEGMGGRTYFENEKRAYGMLMAHAVAGNRAVAIRELQKEDAQAKDWHAITEGIDYYACFTLKHQIRKFFLFRDQFSPDYRARMERGAKRWTEQDPLRRPHPAFQKGGPGWGPDAKNSWVDVRSTENLWLMRVTSVYLLAEFSKNESTRLKYKADLLRYAASLYRVGMGEWDSENYHGHSLSPLLNLYDFAQDPEVKSAAKACLDYVCAIGAVKYYRGAFNGPTNRDYNHAQPFGGSAAAMLWLYFNDTPVINTHYESDEVHVFTSAYRPPVAVMELARKRFEKPVTIWAAKPGYSATTSFDWKSPPEFLETQFIGRTFQLGSLASGTSTGTSAINGFKLTMTDSKLGGIAVQAVPGPDPRFVGSAKYTAGKVSGRNRVAQAGPLAIWLVANGASEWRWVFPDSIRVQVRDGITFLAGEKTWVALTPIHTSLLVVNPQEMAMLSDPKEKDKQWAGHHVLSAKGKGGPFCGVAVEVGESPDFVDFAAFQKAVLERSKLKWDRLEAGEVTWSSAKGTTITFRESESIADMRLAIDGKPHDWREHAAWLYRSDRSDSAPISQPWRGGTLRIVANGKRFECSVFESGQATWHE
ncbi:hypothetical protein [Tuwongella immobilis]|uniref:Uncharacterized protein n=1 Tax=Tuwongella immobilis TaxID=692036 RepID=A0A6C2YMZ9_9BACT|nr:hypothetical protein [Tuwongella immobilis]VIP02816.1 Uncharacterized protein OS=Isosphaera pallida (strain ATCC 43644 / DSM 9630 / IS1B) GN=Isop_3617 PE=4 SV=1 [Tuwongella immobilis]VTS02536.1 Uncharacterized protein OS=Isosphaera pallida (strain ATCC 43644 / DSM 9630 / IS1B) GN=Isop_3617 PE=4 SV=1 [Tuwongella immobilis]